jgi:L-cysteine S-thiosulfotransferase
MMSVLNAFGNGLAPAAVAVCLMFSLQAIAQTSDTRRSGFEFMSAATKALQTDDSQNPAMLWVKQGEALWNKTEGINAKSCASCHQAAQVSMKGIAARYPAFDTALSKPLTLAQKINVCRTQKQGAIALKLESEDLLGLEVFVAHQSRGMPITANDDAKLKPFVSRGKALYVQPMGQLNLSCAQCHDDQAGRRLGSAPIPQAHPTGYPIYRSEWQGLGSLQRRLRNCMSGVRAELFAYGAQELTEIELYLNQRANGMTIETPAVRP